MGRPLNKLQFGYWIDDAVGEQIPFKPELESFEGGGVRGLKDGVRVNLHLIPRPERHAVRVFLGTEGDGDSWASLPHPDCWDPLTSYAGVMSRVAAAQPKTDKQVLKRLKKFVANWLEVNLIPLVESEFTSFDRDSVVAWLEQTDYPLWRRDELLATYDREISVWQKHGGVLKFFSNKSFIKQEPYGGWKQARSINSRTDFYKCVVGPMFKAIERELFTRPEFIKKCPVVERPQYITDKLYSVGRKYFASDFTSFEASFTREVMDAVEMQLYAHSTSKLHHGKPFMRVIRRAMLGNNVLQFSWGTIVVPATRMSGEMCTSLGNSFSNMMVNMFVLHEKGCKNVDCVIEGDDGLFAFEGDVPKREDYFPVGFDIKLSVVDKLSEASFCGLVFDEVDKVNIADPIKVLLNSPWGDIRYKNAKQSKKYSLLRCKALSAAYQYDGAPIITSYSRWLLRRTAKFSARTAYDTMFSDSYKAVEFRRALSWAGVEVGYDFHNLPQPTVVGSGSREVMATVFGVPVDVQLLLESIFDSDADYPTELIEMLYPDHVHDNACYNTDLIVEGGRSPSASLRYAEASAWLGS